MKLKSTTWVTYMQSSEEKEMMFFIFIPEEQLTKLSTKVKVYLKTIDGTIMDKETTTFLGPIKAIQ